MSHEKTLEMRFFGNAVGLRLDLRAYDMDKGDEVRVFVNGTPIGYLAETPNSGFGSSRLTIPKRVLNGAGNTLRFEQRVPGYSWGVTDLRLSVAASKRKAENPFGTVDASTR